MSIFDKDQFAQNIIQMNMIELERWKRNEGSGEWDAGMDCPLFATNTVCTDDNIIDEFFWKSEWSCKNECEAWDVLF